VKDVPAEENEAWNKRSDDWLCVCKYSQDLKDMHRNAKHHNLIKVINVEGRNIWANDDGIDDGDYFSPPIELYNHPAVEQPNDRKNECN